MSRRLKWLAGVTFAGTLLVASLGIYSESRLDPWHTADLSEEFDAGKRGEVASFEEYLELEQRLFDQLDRKVYSRVGGGPALTLVRFSKGSAADPAARSTNFNRSFELQAEAPRGGVLLLHGMSDSPYSLRTLGEALNRQGYWVVGLRLPGHGTAPTGLVRARWQDMAAATSLAADYLERRTAGAPLSVVGYSMGAALALNYTLDAIESPQKTVPARLVFVSPAIGVDPIAALAGARANFGRLPGFGMLAYMSVVPEFDPYKYNSFTANAGAQVYKLTRLLAKRIETIENSGGGDLLPPILVFKSAVDATVSVDAVVDKLLRRLPDSGNELVLFDVNRADVTALLTIADPGPVAQRLLSDETLPFGVTLIGNANPDTHAVVARYKPPFSGAAVREATLDMSWPPGVISLSHVALPFPPDDPLYGRFRPDDPRELFLGQMELRGERGLLRISADWLVRIRYNPFYPVLETRVLDWLALSSPVAEAVADPPP